MNQKSIFNFFSERKQQNIPMALVSVYETKGSTYSKVGGYMVVDSVGQFSGMLSGGCLEGDLAERARDVIESGSPSTVTYDLSLDDELFGLGVGCDGTMKVFLQPLSRSNNYEPLATLVEMLARNESAVIATIVELPDSPSHVGSGVLYGNTVVHYGGVTDDLSAALCDVAAQSDNSHSCLLPVDQTVFLALFTVVPPAPELLILGAGLDSEPVHSFAMQLGWNCEIFDHRPSYIESRNYGGGTTMTCAPQAEMRARVDLGTKNIAIVMSHHLASDRMYLEQLLETDIEYIGLLGPVARKEKLLNDIGIATPSSAADRIYGPVGLRLGGSGPASIALSIIAEMHLHLFCNAPSQN